MGGKTYYMLVIQGGSVSRIPPHDTQKLQSLSETFFNAHQSAHPETLRDKEITYIDSKGLHFSDGTTQSNNSVSPTAPQKQSIFQEFDREKRQILSDFSQVSPRNNSLNSIRSQYRPFLGQTSNEKYSALQVKEAIGQYAFYQLNNIAKTVIKSNPRSHGNIEQLFDKNVFQQNLETGLDAISSGLKMHVTAQTIWETMTNIVQPPEVVYVADPEESDYEDDRELLLVRAPDDFKSYSPLLPLNDSESMLYSDYHQGGYSSEKKDVDRRPFSTYDQELPHRSSTVRRNPEPSLGSPQDGAGLIDFLPEQQASSHPSSKSRRDIGGRNANIASSDGEKMTQRRQRATVNEPNSSKRRESQGYSGSSAASLRPPSVLPASSTSSNQHMLTQRRKEESTTTQFMRLLPTLVYDSSLDSHKKLSPPERKKTAENVARIFYNFMGIGTLPKDLPHFDTNQQILLKEIFDGMPTEIATDIGITRFRYVLNELKKEAGLP